MTEDSILDEADDFFGGWGMGGVEKETEGRPSTSRAFRPVHCRRPHFKESFLRETCVRPRVESR